MTSNNTQDFTKNFCDNISLAAFTMVQPYGSLLVIERNTLAIIQYSENVVQLLNIPGLSVEGQLITDFLTVEDKSDDLRSWLITIDKSYRRFIWKGKDALLPVWIYIHQQSNLILLEIELVEHSDSEEQALSMIEEIINLKIDDNSIDREKCALQFCEAIVSITACDRSILYRFESDKSGLVIGESTKKMDSYLGLRFPATDIPENIRSMYLRQPIRYIANIDDAPIALIPNIAEKLDLSDVMLRAVSPVHLEYLRNMGVFSDLSVAIINNNTLWGLIVCHYSEPKKIPLHCRLAVMLLSKVMGKDLISIDKIIESKAEVAIFEGLKKIQDIIYNQNTIAAAFAKINKDLLKLFSADGVVYFYNNRLSSAGLTPDEAQIRNLIEWLKEYHSFKTFATHTLPQDYLPSVNFVSHACGLLATPSITGKHFLLFFRNEQVYEDLWSGDPDNVLIRHGEDYSPRKSFIAWKKIVHNQSIKWETFEVAAAHALSQILTIKQLEQASQDL